jgi:hypothetical protein
VLTSHIAQIKSADMVRLLETFHPKALTVYCRAKRCKMKPSKLVRAWALFAGVKADFTQHSKPWIYSRLKRWVRCNHILRVQEAPRTLR